MRLAMRRATVEVARQGGRAIPYVHDIWVIRRKARNTKMDVKYLSEPNYGLHVNLNKEERDFTEIRMITRCGNNLIRCV